MTEYVIPDSIPDDAPYSDSLSDDTDDGNAPYGINPKTGKPYTASPEERAQLAERLKTAREAKAAKNKGIPLTQAPSVQAPPPKKRGPGRPSKSVQASDYTVALQGVVQTGVFVLSAGSRFKPALALDAVTLALKSGPLIEAINTTAQTDPRLAKVLDKISAVGPYSMVFAAAMGLGVQIAANHGVIPVNPQMGILSPEELMAEAEGLTATG